MLPVLFYGGLSTLLVMSVTGTLGAVFPHEQAKDIGEDSEALVLALVLAGWIGFVRPRLAGTRREWTTVLLAAAGFLTVGVWMYASADHPSAVATLNEPMLALVVLLPYVQLRRPVSRLVALVMPVAVVLLVLLARNAPVVIRLAELLAMLVLVPLGLDVADRRILDPAAADVPVLRWSWCVLLLLTPPLLSWLLRDTFAGVVGHVIRYTIQAQEAWVGVLLLHLYFGALLVPLGPRRSPGRRAERKGL